MPYSDVAYKRPFNPGPKTTLPLRWDIIDLTKRYLFPRAGIFAGILTLCLKVLEGCRV